jgi:hypothetical protein
MELFSGLRRAGDDPSEVQAWCHGITGSLPPRGFVRVHLGDAPSLRIQGHRGHSEKGWGSTGGCRNVECPSAKMGAVESQSEDWRQASNYQLRSPARRNQLKSFGAEKQTQLDSVPPAPMLHEVPSA